MVSAINDGNISGTNRKNSYYCIYCPDIKKILPERKQISGILTRHEEGRVKDTKKRRNFAVAS